MFSLSDVSEQAFSYDGLMEELPKTLYSYYKYKGDKRMVDLVTEDGLPIFHDLIKHALHNTTDP